MNFTQRRREAESAERELLKREVSERVLKKEKKLSESELRERIFGK